VPLEALWVNHLQPEVSSYGQTVRAVAAGQKMIATNLAQMYFTFMAGPPATLYIAGFPFEQKLNRFRSDFTVPVSAAIRNGALGKGGIAGELLFLRQIADGLCREWVQKYHRAILVLTEFLESAQRIPIPGGERSELRGVALQEALASAWGPEKPSTHDTVVLALATYSPNRAMVEASRLGRCCWSSLGGRWRARSPLGCLASYPYARLRAVESRCGAVV
jgi:hypothetical protein